jgi:hypothetical protein
MNKSGKCSILINGETIDLRFGMHAARTYFEKAINEGSAFYSGNILNEMGIASLIYAGYENHCLVNDKKIVKTLGYFLEFVEDSLVDEDSKNKLKEVVDCFSESKSVETIANNIDTDNAKDKKKQIGMK